MIKRVISLALSLILITIMFENMAVYSTVPEKLITANDFISFSVNTQNGRFSVKTVEGTPMKKGDERENLLFEHEKPDTSFTTFRIDGEDYIYGNSYDFMNKGGYFTQKPISKKNRVESTWKVGDIEITQKLELVEDVESPNVGNVKVTYIIANKGSKAHTIGSRILLDTMLGSSDSSYIQLSGENDYINKETHLIGEDVPDYWRSVTDIFRPDMVAYGLLSGWGNTKPSEMIIGHWASLSETKWDYQVDETLNFTKSTNRYDYSDSAVALYWEPREVKPKRSIEIETYYGLGDFTGTLDENNNYNTTMNAPDQLNINETNTGYEDFTIGVEIDNSLENSETINDMSLELILPESMETIDGDKVIQAEPIISGETYTYEWNVRSDVSNEYIAKEISVALKHGQVNQDISSYIIVPGIKSDPPDIRYQQLTPSKLYIHDEIKSIKIEGTGFEVMKDKSNWRMLLQKTGSENKVAIPKDDIFVVDDTITVNLDEAVPIETGQYTLIIDSDSELINDYTFLTKIEGTEDKKYSQKKYGLFAIVKNSEGYDDLYRIEKLNTEEELDILIDELDKEEEVVLEIRGKMMEKSNGVYEGTSTSNERISFNNLLNYDSDDPLVITEKDDEVYIEGNGKLRLPNDLTVWRWGFEIELKEGLEIGYEEDEEVEGVEVDLLGYGVAAIELFDMPIKLRNIILTTGEDRGISFGGEMELSFLKEDKYEADKKSAKEDDKPNKDDYSVGLGAEVNNVLYGFESDKDEEFKFLGADFETEFKLGTDFLPIGMDFGTEASLAVNTFDNEYKMSLDAAIKVIEFGVTIGLVENPATNNLFLDELIIYGGYEPGIPIIPPIPVVYITKLGGGFSNLSSLMLEGEHESPMEIVFIAGIDAVKLFKADPIEIRASMEGFSIKGGLDLAGTKFEILEEVLLKAQWSDPWSVKGRGKLNILDGILKGDVSIILGNPPFHLHGKVSASIPDKVRFVGGSKIASLQVGAGTENVYGMATVLGLDVGVKYIWGKDVDFKLASLEQDINGPIAMDKSFQIDEDGESNVMLYGTNIKRVGSSNNSAFASTENHKPIIIANSEKTTFDLDIYDQDAALIELEYEGEAPNITLKDPDGQEVKLVENENYLLNEYNGKNYMYISIIEPINGTWSIESDKDLPNVYLNDVKMNANIDSLSTSVVGQDKIKIDYMTSNSEDSVMDLYLTQDNIDDAGYQIATDVNLNDNSVTVNLPEGIASGDYYVRAELNTELENGEPVGYNSDYSNSFTYTSPYEPDSVEKVKLEAIGNGIIKGNWEAPGSSDITGYSIKVLDENSMPIEGLTPLYVDANKTSVNIGGIAELDGEKNGLQVDENYKIAVSSYREIEKNENTYMYHSNEVESNLEYLPEPIPAETELSLLSNDTLVSKKDEQGKPTIYTNNGTMDVEFTSDQYVTTSIYLNDEYVTTTEGKRFTYPLNNLEEGVHKIVSASVNSNGDTTKSNLQVIVDETAPNLMINSPEVSDSSNDGEIIVSGVTDSGSRVKVNGELIKVNGDGTFDASILMDDVLYKTVEIEAIDIVGNKNSYIAEVSNDLVDSIVDVRIKSELSIEEVIKSSESIDLKLVGKDEDGTEVELNNSQVEWSLLQGQEISEIDETGILKAYQGGKAIVLAQYNIADNYSFEDAISLEFEEEEIQEIIYDGKIVNDNNETQDQVELIWEDISGNKKEGVLIESSLRYNRPAKVKVDQEMILQIPEETLNYDYNLKVSRELKENIKNQANMTFISDIYDIEVGEGDYGKDVQLELRYNSMEVKDARKLAIYGYDNQLEEWDYVGSKITSDSTIIANLNHYREYALIYNEGLTIMEDIDKRWSKDVINRLITKGIINGVYNSSQKEYYFNPKNEITRGEFITLLVNALYKDEILEGKVSKFDDWDQLPNWVKPYIYTAYEEDVLEGTITSDKILVNANDPITRAEAFTIIARSLTSENVANNIEEQRYVDSHTIPSWAKSWVNYLISTEIIEGYPDGTIKGNDAITREEAAVLISNILQ
ncbi:MAG: S-layer homology domain-containing protein [Eubacteriales bacterium]